VRKIAEVIKARQKGQALEDAIEASFAPQQQVPPAGVPTQAVEQPSPAPAGAPVGGAPTAPPAQAPDIMSLLSGLSGGGEATASVRTARKM
jgi:hypothetical protein